MRKRESHRQRLGNEESKGGGDLEMLKNVGVVLTALILTSVSGPLMAHHGNAAYNEAKLVTVKAVVTEWIWANPHCFLRFDVTDDSGKIAHWTAETSNPPDMIGHGWSKNMLKPGDQLTIVMLTVKNGQPIGRIRQITLADGRTFTNEGGIRNPSLNNAPASDIPKQ
jgi:uncharacterized protein DUF6152